MALIILFSILVLFAGIFISGLIKYFRGTIKGKGINHINYFLRDTNYPDLLHIFGTKSYRKQMNTTATYAHCHYIFDINTLKTSLLSNPRKSHYDQNDDDITDCLRYASKKRNANYDADVNAPLNKKGSFRFHLYHEPLDNTDITPYPSDKGDRIVFITDISKINNKIEVKIYSGHVLLNSFIISGSIHVQYKEVYIHEKQLYLFTYQNDDFHSEKDVALCILNYKTGELIQNAIIGV